MHTQQTSTNARGTTRCVVALLLLPPYLAVLRWEIQHRRWRYTPYTVLFPIMVVLAL